MLLNSLCQVLDGKREPSLSHGPGTGPRATGLIARFRFPKHKDVFAIGREEAAKPNPQRGSEALSSGVKDLPGARYGHHLATGPSTTGSLQ